MKKLLALVLALAVFLCCLTACDTFGNIFGGKSGVSKEYYENCAVFTFNDFKSKICITLDRTGLGEGTIYYQVNLNEGALSVKYSDVGLINENQLLSEFSAEDEMPAGGSGGYIEGDKIAITFEAFSPVKGEIIIAFTEVALKAVYKELNRHEHTFVYETRADAHKKIYTCDCTNLEYRDFEPHYDEDNNGECDECEYFVGISHEYHDYYYDTNEDSHMQVFTCGCVSEGFEPHYSNDGDEFCDECGWNMLGHVHTWENYRDEIGHGWAYTCGCDTPPNFAQHLDSDGDGKCDDCKYVMYEIPVIQENGIVYEKDGNESYSVVGFLGDDDGIVEIPDTYNGLPVRYIRGNAFYGAEAITELIVGDNVLVIEGNAFMKCCNLEKVTLGKSLTLIDMQAFLGCEKLETITIPATVTFIGSGAFKKCSRLKSVILGNPEDWCISSDVYNRPFPTEDMSDAETVAKYFTDTYVGVAWLKE